MSEQENREKPVQKKHGLRTLWLIAKYFSLLLLISLLACGGFAWWVMATPGGQSWLVKTANGFLAPAGDKNTVWLQIAGISGTLPFNFEVGIEAYDGEGLWLKAPHNRFRLDWTRLPGVLQIEQLKISDADLQRLPKLPPSPPPEPSAPFTLADFKNILAQAQDFLSKKPWWLPEIRLGGIGFENALLPSGMIPQKDAEKRLSFSAELDASLISGHLLAQLNAKALNADGSALDLGQISLKDLTLALKVNAAANQELLKADTSLQMVLDEPLLAVEGLPANFLGEQTVLDLALVAAADALGPTPSLQAKLVGPQLAAGDLLIKTTADWHSGAAWRDNVLDGPLQFDLSASVSPHPGLADSPLNMLLAPVNLALKAGGNLPSIALSLDLDCPALQIQKHEISDLKLLLKSPEVDLPLSKSGFEALADENHVRLNLEALLDRQKISLASEIFFQGDELNPGGSDMKGQIWRAGLRNLELNALDISCKGDLAAILWPKAKMPALDGKLKLNLDKWQGVQAFAPDQHFSGNVDLDIDLSSGLSNDPAEKIRLADMRPAASGQNANLDLKISNFALRPKGGDAVSINKLALQAGARDIFADLSLAAKLVSSGIQAAGLRLDAKADVSGPLKGPLKLALQTSGDVKSDLAAAWQPGKVDVDALKVSMNPAKLLAGSGKSAMLGIALAHSAEASYGDEGVRISGLDLKITPSGRLQANGGVGPDKLDFNLSLENLAFKPWQELAPALPQGSADIHLKLRGTPKKPGGDFRAELKQIKIPGAPLAPIGLTLDGGLRHEASGSVFALKLEVDAATRKALGANAAQVSAAIPLSFDQSGMPALNMAGPLAARIHWDGALGPIWNLIPVADQRLNGRLRINLDAGGTLKAPVIRGGVHIEKARYENLLLGVLLTDMSLHCELSEKAPLRKIATASLPGGMTLAASISDGHRGSVKIDGKGDLDGKNLDVKINIDRLKPLRRRDIHVEISGDLTVAGDALSPNVAGKIVVDRGEVLLDNLAMSGSVTTLDISNVSAQKNEDAKKQAAQAPASSPVGNLNIAARMLPRFRVDGRGLGSVWEASLLIQGPLNNPQVTGTINAVSGNFDFLGKIFQLSKGVVTFAGGSLANPLLDLELTNETPDLTAHIYILGPVNKMRLVLSSEPSVPRDEIISRVLFGKSINDLSRLEALQLAAAVAQLAGFGGGGGILSFTKKALGIDVLRLGTSSSGATGEDGSGGAGGTTIEAGKYITDKLYMGVQQGMKADSTAFIIQFELTPRTSLEVRSEQNNTWGGLNWKYNY